MYFLEPEGNSFKLSAERLEALEERIYKAAYLQDQGRSSKATPAMQSGYSKQMDKMPSKDALSGIASVIRPAMQAVYQDVTEIRGFDVNIDIRGMDFTDKAGIEEMDFMEKSTVVDVNSPTFERERGKKFARVVLPDLNPETLKIIDDEIDANPTPDEELAKQMRCSFC